MDVLCGRFRRFQAFLSLLCVVPGDNTFDSGLLSVPRVFATLPASSFLGYSGVLPLSGLVFVGSCLCRVLPLPGGNVVATCPGRPSLARGRPESVACVPSIPLRIWASEYPNRSRPGAGRTPRQSGLRTPPAARIAPPGPVFRPDAARPQRSYSGWPAFQCGCPYVGPVSVWGFGVSGGRWPAGMTLPSGPWPAASRRRCPESPGAATAMPVSACLPVGAARPVASGWPVVAALSAAAAPLRVPKVCAASSDSAAREAWPLPQRLSI